MRYQECPFETSVLDALGLDEWPDELDAHLRSCDVCSDLAEVARACTDDYSQLLFQSRMPPAALVWWRAELQARQEAARKATRPITLIHAIAMACAVGSGFAVLRLVLTPAAGTTPTSWERLSGWAATYLSSGMADVSGLMAMMDPLGIVLLVSVCCCLMCAPVAAYFIFSDD